MDRYTVWIGGIEANQYYVTEKEAESIAAFFISEGYTDVIIERI
jgi:hypothetical protein|tara:strand:+ start:1480 stop:1611 length:132 start_codon:yes stop_codon:yes gene_type:complete